MRSFIILLFITCCPIGLWAQFYNPQEPSAEPPYASFSSEVYKLGVKFDNHTRNASRYEWNFGDGTTSTEKNPEHIYAKTGTYWVTLTASNGIGERTSSQYVYITEDFSMYGTFTLNAQAEGIRNFQTLDALFTDLRNVPFAGDITILIESEESFTLSGWSVSEITETIEQKLADRNLKPIRWENNSGYMVELKLWDTFNKEVFQEMEELTEIFNFSSSSIELLAGDARFSPYHVIHRFKEPQIVCYNSYVNYLNLKNISDILNYPWQVVEAPEGVTGYAESGNNEISSQRILNSTNEIQVLKYEVDFVYQGETLKTDTINYYIYPENPTLTLLEPAENGMVAFPDQVTVSWEPLPGAQYYHVYYRKVGGDTEYESTSSISADLSEYTLRNYNDYFQFDNTYEWYMVARTPCSNITSETRTFTIGSAPDLEITDIRVSPTTAISGKEFTITATVTNVGTKDLEPSSWRDVWYKIEDESTYYEDDVDHSSLGLAIGESYEVQYTMTAPYDESIDLLTFELQIDYFEDIPELSEENNRKEIEVPISLLNIPEEEFAVLCDLYELAGGEDWNMSRPWDISTSAVDDYGWEGLTLDDEGHVIEIDLSERGLKGSIPASLFSMPYLQILDLSQNALTGKMEELVTENASAVNLKKLNLSNNLFSGTITNSFSQLTGLKEVFLGSNRLEDIDYIFPWDPFYVNLSYQTLHIADKALSPAHFDFDIPGICLYDHDQRSLETYPTFSLANLDESNPVEWIYNTEEQLYKPKYDYNHPYLNLPPNQDLVFEQETGSAYGSRDTIQLAFEMGDANLDAAVNIADVRHTLNFIFDEMTYGAYIQFNYYAANTLADETINVQDMVSTVNLILENPALDVQTMNLRSQGTTAYLSIEGDRLVIQNPVSLIMDMDILLKGVSSQQLELLLPKEQFLYQVKDTQEGVRIILIGMNTSGIGLGKHEIIKIKGGNATIGHAMLVNKEAKEVPSDYEGKIHQTPTGNEGLCTEVADPTHIRIDSEVQAIRFSVYDLSGRVLTTSRIDKPVPGEYSIYPWIPQRLPSGVYLLRIEMQKEKETLYQTIKFSQIK